MGGILGFLVLFSFALCRCIFLCYLHCIVLRAFLSVHRARNEAKNLQTDERDSIRCITESDCRINYEHTAKPTEFEGSREITVQSMANQRKSSIP